MSSTKNNNKTLMFLFAAVFLLPVILAKLALDNGWFNQAATNQGVLLTPPVDMGIIDTADVAPKWKLLYVLPEVCESECKNALYSIAQVHSALGKHSDRAEVVVMVHQNSNLTQITQLQEKQNIRLIRVKLESLQQVFKDNDTDGIFIADTLDNVILRYPLQKEQEQAVLHSRDILADMRKVLKLSRIG